MVVRAKSKGGKRTCFGSFGWPRPFSVCLNASLFCPSDAFKNDRFTAWQKRESQFRVARFDEFLQPYPSPVFAISPIRNICFLLMCDIRRESTDSRGSGHRRCILLVLIMGWNGSDRKQREMTVC